MMKKLFILILLVPILSCSKNDPKENSQVSPNDSTIKNPSAAATAVAAPEKIHYIDSLLGKWLYVNKNEQNEYVLEINKNTPESCITVTKEGNDYFITSSFVQEEPGVFKYKVDSCSYQYGGSILNVYEYDVFLTNTETKQQTDFLFTPIKGDMNEVIRIYTDPVKRHFIRENQKSKVQTIDMTVENEDM